jgi:hypothetical protein
VGEAKMIVMITADDMTVEFSDRTNPRGRNVARY